MFAASKTDSVSGGPPDDKFNYVTMLLHGDGTNGAQNNTFLDSGPNTLSITRNGNTTQGSFSPYGSNWSNYIGSGNKLDGPTNAAFAFGTGDFTISAWVFIANGTSAQIIWTNQTTSSASAPNLGFFILNNKVCINNTNTSHSESTGTIANNTWAYVGVTRASGTYTFYINGSASGTTSSIGNNDFTENACRIGYGNYGSGFHFGGYISNLRIIKGSAVTPSVPTTPLTAISGTSLLTCQSNRFIDNSSNAFAITATGSPSVQRFNPFGTSTAYSTSVIGGSGYFDGTGDRLNVSGTNSGLAFGSGDFTIEMFFYISAFTNTYTALYDARPTTTNGAYPNISITSGRLYYYVSSAERIATANSTITTGQWYHVAVSRSGTSTKMFLNGTQVGSTYTDTTTYLNGTDRPTIGAEGYNSSPNDIVNGYVSNVRTLTGTALYTTTFTPPTAPLTAITNTSLLTNMTNAGIFDNAMMNDLETVGNAQISTSVKKYGTGSLYFDGTGDWLTSPDNPSLEFGSGNFTLECWINTTVSNSGYVSAVSKWGTSNQSWMIRAASTDIGSGWSFFYSDDGSSYYTVFGSSINDGNWHHLAVTRSGNVFRTFTDGTLNNSRTDTVPLFDGTASLFVGAQSGGANPFTGYIDDVRITKGIARYTASFTAPTAAFSDTGPY